MVFAKTWNHLSLIHRTRQDVLDGRVEYDVTVCWRAGFNGGKRSTECIEKSLNVAVTSTEKSRLCWAGRAERYLVNDQDMYWTCSKYRIMRRNVRAGRSISMAGHSSFDLQLCHQRRSPGIKLCFTAGKNLPKYFARLWSNKEGQ